MHCTLRRRYVFVSEDRHLRNEIGKAFARERIPMISAHRIGEDEREYQKFIQRSLEPHIRYSPLLVIPNASMRDYEKLKKLRCIIPFSGIHIEEPGIPGLGLLLHHEVNEFYSLVYATSIQKIAKQILLNNLGEKC